MTDKENAGRFTPPSAKLDIGSIAGRKNGLVKIELPLKEMPGQTAYVLVPIETVVEGLVEYAAGPSLDYELQKAYANGDGVRLELRRIVPRHVCRSCGEDPDKEPA